MLFPQNHELGNLTTLTFQDLAKYPIVTYKEPSSGNSGLVKAMQTKKLKANIVFTARDADIIKTYVRKNIGIGIVAEMAFDPKIDSDLIGYSTKSLLPRCTTWLAFNKNLLMRNYMYCFIELFAPHLTRESVNQYLSKEKKIAQKTSQDKKESRLPMHQMWHI